MCGPGVRDRRDRVHVDRILLVEFPADPAADIVHEHPVDDRIRTGEVDVLKDAVRPLLRHRDLEAFHFVGIDPDQLAGPDIPDELRAQGVHGNALRCHHVPVIGLPDPEGLDPERVAEPVHNAVDQEDGGVGSHELVHAAGHRVLDRPGPAQRID